MIRAVIFDYGDTLVVRKHRDEPVSARALEKSYAVFRSLFPQLDRDRFLDEDRKVFSDYADEEALLQRDIGDEVKYLKLTEELLPDFPASVRRVVASRANTAFWNTVIEMHKPAPWMRPTLGRLDEMGLKMAVISNHHNGQALRSHLKKLGILEYFSQVVASSDLPCRKPDPRIFRVCVRALGIRPEESAYVGDSLANDVAGANGVGMVSVWMRNARGKTRAGRGSGPVPAYVAQSLRELPGIVKTENRIGH